MMLSRKLFSVFGVLALMMLILSSSAFANKSAVSIQAPTEVPRGSETVIRVTVTHNDNNPVHYTEWLYVTMNGKEVARWNYTAFNRPEAATFTKELKLTATENMDVKAEASCNLHGSAGPATSKILTKD
jgi:desulfoferrodoxin (superoxide reductase-like protein)